MDCRASRSNVVSSTANLRRASSSSGCMLPAMTREWSGGPRSTSDNCCSDPTRIACVSDPTRATPTQIELASKTEKIQRISIECVVTT